MHVCGVDENEFNRTCSWMSHSELNRDTGCPDSSSRMEERGTAVESALIAEKCEIRKEKMNAQLRRWCDRRSVKRK